MSGHWKWVNDENPKKKTETKSESGCGCWFPCSCKNGKKPKKVNTEVERRVDCSGRDKTPYEY